MNKVIGYAISVVGILVMAIGLKIVPFTSALLDGIEPKFISVAGIIVIAVGVVLALNSDDKKRGNKKSSHKHAGHDEIPIYEGTGKNRRVVGYRKD